MEPVAPGDEPGEESIVEYKYIIGCNRAYSWVREKLGITMEGAQTESVWGVMDTVPVTDFREHPIQISLVANTGYC
jgi:phenol 2-monooxygenase